MCSSEIVVQTFLFILLSPTPGTLSQPNVKIGGLFDIWDPYEETAFLHATERVNSDQNAFPWYNIQGILEKVQRGDSYNASKQVCALLEEGIAGIIGPQTPIAASHVQSVSEVFNIPRIETKWDFRGSRGQFLINLYPHPRTLSKAYADVIGDYGWSEVVIIYENNESLIRLQGIFELTGNIIKQYVVKQLPASEEGEDDFRPIMKDLKTNYNTITHIILDCQSAKLPRLFEDAKTENMTTHDHEYFLTSLDIHLLDPSDKAFTNVNITAFRMVDPNNPKLQSILESWHVNSALAGRRSDFFGEDPFLVPNYRRPKYDEHSFPNLNLNMFMVDTALIYDAIEVFSMGLQQVAKEFTQPFRPEQKDCDAVPISPWIQGFNFIKALKQVTFQGITGDIRIDEDGKRRKFKMEVVELTNNNFSVIGEWSSLRPKHLQWTRAESETLLLQIEELKGRTLIVTSKQSPPYVKFFDNGTYEGYAVDLISELGKHFQFKAEFHKVEDGKMGSPDPSYKYGWNGLVGEILEGKAHLAIGDMSITSGRASVIDFSLPFMNIGISILYKKPEKTAPSLFSFLDPFHYEVWIYMATAYLGVSLILFILARITPYEWLNPHPCIESPDELELTLHLVNSLWFTIGTLMQQGSDIAPKAGSTRMVAGIWWFFTLILISSYTANLAAFLTSEGMVEGIKDIKDLPKQTKVKYGTLVSGSTRDFFKMATFPLYQEIGKNMESMSPSPHVDSTEKGVERVLTSKGEYAFFMESAGIEYAMERECSLVQLGLPLDSKGFGIGFRKGSKFRNAFNIKLLDMAQNAELEKLKIRWWREKGGGKCKTETSSNSGAQPLTLGHVGGVFVVLLGGCIMAIIMGIFEFMWRARKLRKEVLNSYWSEVWKELKFSLQCQNETKPIKKSLSMNPTMQSESVPYLAFNSGGSGGGGGGNQFENSGNNENN